MSTKTTPAIERAAAALPLYRVETARAVLAAGLDVEEIARTLDGHRPVMSVLDGIIRITGCRCLDRVFFRNSGEVGESWEGHLSIAVRIAILGDQS